jgi:putative hydrolase
MADNIFEQFAEMLSSPGPVNWKLAEEMAKSVVRSPPGVPDPHLYEPLFGVIEVHLADVSPLATPDERPNLVTARQFLETNLQGLAYLLEPMGELMGRSMSTEESPIPIPLDGIAPALIGMQAGSLMGMLALRTMGHFDSLLPLLGGRQELVAANVEAFADNHDLDPAQVRLWALAMERITEAEYGVAWLPEHIASLINQYLADLEIDPTVLMGRFEGLEDMGNMPDPAEIEATINAPGSLSGLLTGPHQAEDVAAIRALTAFIAGYADYRLDVMESVITDLSRIREAFDRRLAAPAQGEQMLVNLLGLDFDRGHYRKAASFCREVTERLGTDALAAAWAKPENLPTEAELDDPVGWVARTIEDSNLLSEIPDDLSGLDFDEPDNPEKEAD